MIIVKFIVGFEVLAPVVMRNSNFRDITACNPLKVNGRFGGTCRFACHLLHTGFLLGLVFNLEDGSDILLRNIS
jgi:hypothetical protein